MIHKFSSMVIYCNAAKVYFSLKLEEGNKVIVVKRKLDIPYCLNNEL